MRRHVALITKVDPFWEHTQTGYLVAGYRLERWSGNRWTIAEATHSFENLGAALDWITTKKGT